MGLAASQARFLAITARKANCEFQSMQIAQEKLSISNDMTKATEQYQNALNMTKLVWDPDGTGEHTTELSYNLLMTPSALNGYDPYLVTARTGQIALNSSYAAAARAAGIDRKGGVQGTEAGRNEFLTQLTNQGLITKSTCNIISTNPYSISAGVGGKPLDKTAANAVSNSTLALITSDQAYNLKLEDMIKTMGVDFSNYNRASGMALTENGSGPISDRNAFSKLTLGDLLNNEYVLVYAAPDNKSTHPGTDEMTKFINNIFGTAPFAEDNKSLFGTIVNKLGSLLNVDTAGDKAFNFAYKKILQMYSADSATNAGVPSSTRKSFNAANKKASEVNGIVYTNDDDLKKSENAHIAVNLSNMVSSFLTYYAQQLQSNTGYQVRKTDNNSVYVTDDMNYMYKIKNNDAVTEKDLLMTDFYNALYNNLCLNGWTEEFADNLDDPKYLSHALKNGQLFISSLCEDGYYYQDAYNANGYMVEITDDDAITQAELEYQIAKSKLNYQEERLDVEMKNVDMEISSLTTEYDTVKNLISKNVEKIFTMFQS